MPPLSTPRDAADREVAGLHEVGVPHVPASGGPLMSETSVGPRASLSVSVRAFVGLGSGLGLGRSGFGFGSASASG